MKEVLIQKQETKKQKSHITPHTAYNSGITIVALIITIIVLLILAVVTIRAVSEDGIIAKAKYAKEEQRGAKVQEQKGLFEIELKISKYDGDTQKALNDLLDKLEEEKLITEEEKNAIIETGRITIGSKEIIFSEDATLPYGYKRCEYLESTGTQYIELGILLTNSDEINTVFLFTEVDTSFKRLFGARNAYESNAYYLVKIGSTNNFRFDYGNYVYTTNIKAEKDIKYNVSIKNNIFTINNESINLTSSDFDTVALASLFYAHSNSGENYTESPKIRFYSFEIKNKMRLIPCLDKNGKPCMYDTVSKTPFYNQGTGEFIAGPIVE